MKFVVTPTPKARRAIGRQILWKQREHSERAANRWFAALSRAMDSLADMPESRPICRESDDLPGPGPYREHYFGVGQSKTHRLVFRVTPAAVEVVAVRGFGQRDLTERDV